jgi:Uma2 family endonuclease
MATATLPPALKIGPADHGRRLTLDEFIEADFVEGWLYELARGVVEVTEIPGPWHGRIVLRIAAMFIHYSERHPGVIKYQGGTGEFRMRLPGMVSDRHPDQAIYLDPEPPGSKVWTRWVPHITVEVLSPGGEERDLIDKVEEYLRVGVREYWVLDAVRRQLHVFVREGDTWDLTILPETAVYRTSLLPGLEVHPNLLLGSAAEK